MTTLDILFGAVGLITAASAVLAVTTRQLVHAALWLIVTLGTLAGCYLILGAELVALVQLLIYVGAVVVLVLFALMLTRAPIGPSPEHSSSAVQRAAAGVIGAGTTALFASVLLPALGGEIRTPRAGDTQGIATQLFGSWVWPFELLSILLLMALIAALAVSRMPTVSAAPAAPPVPAVPAASAAPPVPAVPRAQTVPTVPSVPAGGESA
jgi:NADH-quinone oxidoreductase subunit J